MRSTIPRRVLSRLASSRRGDQTASEKALTAALTKAAVGAVFWPEYPIASRWIADFYCRPLRLAVEVDGGYHTTPAQMAKDAERDAAFLAHGVSVLRFTNERVASDLAGVIKAIGARVRALTVVRRRAEPSRYWSADRWLAGVAKRKAKG